MNGIAGTVRGVLEPHVGRPLAETAVRTTAISLGKTSEELTADDLPALLQQTSYIMSGVATQACIDVAIKQIMVETA